MTVRTRYSPYSYRDDPVVPEFDDKGPVVFMDGECALCSWSARTICRLDKGRAFRICPVQSPLGQAVLGHYGLDVSDPDSWLYLEDGLAYSSMDAVIRAGWRLGGLGRLVAVFKVFPLSLRNWLYRRIAQNRYRLFGRADLCSLPDDDLRKRLIG